MTATKNELFFATAGQLADSLKLAHAGKIPGTRELIPQVSYRLVHELDNATGTV